MRRVFESNVNVKIGRWFTPQGMDRWFDRRMAPHPYMDGDVPAMHGEIENSYPPVADPPEEWMSPTFTIGTIDEGKRPGEMQLTPFEVVSSATTDENGWEYAVHQGASVWQPMLHEGLHSVRKRLWRRGIHNDLMIDEDDVLRLTSDDDSVAGQF